MSKARAKPGYYLCENCGEEIIKSETHYNPPVGKYKASWTCQKGVKK